ncbi:uncharacterized protein MELLADRAFT_62841 [Melampsora larici-populina 98AG31]|uniref:Secreted protein n=1 Tax=Melampsora larici-populina (strain 98AG31 / pathotype 3-4-7) TaxID=747676 RepID=F4RKG4_MELLP|nr:uncharacterized protein MELLADRAFT_62841 [Melampsora larici-populina 98AG31]EGG07186.1 secreted protein [Melampsora larici-populina 98AG31]
MNSNFNLRFLITLLISFDLILTSPLPAKSRQQIIKDANIDPKQITLGAKVFELISKIEDKDVITIPKDALEVIEKLSKDSNLSENDKKALKNCRDAAAKNNSAARDRNDKNTPVGQIYFVTNKLTLRACGAALGEKKDQTLIAGIVSNLMIRIGEVEEKGSLPKIPPVSL